MHHDNITMVFVHIVIICMHVKPTLTSSSQPSSSFSMQPWHLLTRLSPHIGCRTPYFARESRLLRWTGRFKGFQRQLCFDTASSVFRTVKRGRVAGLSTLFCVVLFFSQLSALTHPVSFLFSCALFSLSRWSVFLAARLFFPDR